MLAGCQTEVTQKEYTLILNGNDGSGSVESIKKAENEEINLPSVTFTRKGYEFTGWNTAMDGSGRVYAGGDKFKFTADTVLYAQWKKTETTPANPDSGSPKISYTITFNSNGGSGEMKALTAEEGTEITLTENAFTREGYTFSGWAASADGNIVHTDGAKIKVTADITLYAQWTEIGKVEKVTFSATGEIDYNEKITLSCGTDGATIYYLLVTGTNAPTAEEFSSSKQKYSDPLAITENAVIAAVAVKDGLKDSEMATASFTVKTYTVTFETEHVPAPTKIEGLKKGDKLGDRLPELTAEGYKFDGWFNGETQFTTETEISSDITLTARWTKTYIITFDANGGTGSIASISAEEGSEITLPENAFTKDGYIFTGWATSADGSVSYSDKATITLTGNITLYATWGMTAAKAISIIENFDDGEEHTVTIAGNITADDIAKIKEAIDGNKDSPKIILDLGGTTGLTEIPYQSFQVCENLAGIVIPEGVTTINDFAFNGCTGLKTVSLPKDINFGSFVFNACNSIAHVNFSGTMEEFANLGGIDYCSELFKAEITFGDGTSWTLGKEIRNALKSESVPNVSFSGEWNSATNKMIKLSIDANNKQINLDLSAMTGLKEIAGDYYTGRFNVAELVLPSCAEKICDGAFSNHLYIESIVIPDGIKTIGKEAFFQCNYLKNVVIPSSVTLIGDNAFRECDIYSISVDSEIIGKGAFCSNPNMAYATESSVSEIIIGPNVKEICDDAFTSNELLKSITIPDNVKTLGSLIFYHCDSLETADIKFTDDSEDSGTAIFDACEKLKNVRIRDGSVKIPAVAFNRCKSLESIEIPASVKTIGEGAFRGCDSLKALNYAGKKGDLTIEDNNDDIISKIKYNEE